MRTCYVFRSHSAPDLRGFTEDPSGATLPPEDGPWYLVQQIGPDEEWAIDVGRGVVAAGIMENGFLLWGARDQRPSSKPVIESDRVEGTVVFDQRGNRIGTIKRLIIEKVSGRVIYVDVTFGGFFGMGAHHHTVPSDKLTYDREFSGYRTDITPEQLEAAPELYGDEGIWPDPRREQQIRRYWDEPLPRHPL